eukprot:jgi/Mesvir1/26219/Mv02401-RA.3
MVGKGLLIALGCLVCLTLLSLVFERMELSLFFQNLSDKEVASPGEEHGFSLTGSSAHHFLKSLHGFAKASTTKQPQLLPNPNITWLGFVEQGSPEEKAMLDTSPSNPHSHPGHEPSAGRTVPGSTPGAHTLERPTAPSPAISTPAAPRPAVRTIRKPVRRGARKPGRKPPAKRPSGAAKAPATPRPVHLNPYLNAVARVVSASQLLATANHEFSLGGGTYENYTRWLAAGATNGSALQGGISMNKSTIQGGTRANGFALQGGSPAGVHPGKNATSLGASTLQVGQTLPIRCSSRQDCPPGKLCVDGVCECPVLYSGNANCTAHTWVSHPWCVMPMSHALFVGSRRFSSRIRRVMPSFAALDGGKKDVHQRARFDTCAVVASSKQLLGRGHGRDIDNHTAVVRFNNAPTKGYEKHVGSKTTLRIQNRVWCGFTDTKGPELCMQYSLPAGSRHVCEHWKRCVRLLPSMMSANYIHWYWKTVLPPPPHDKMMEKLSGGFYGILLALHICGKVDLYGFTSSEGHYYKKPVTVAPRQGCPAWGCGKMKPFAQR